MNPTRVSRSSVSALTDLPNVGPSIAQDLRRLGVRAPNDLVGRSPLELYEELNRRTRQRHDPCLLDVFMSVTSFMNGQPPRPWWTFTAKRKRLLTMRARG